MALKALAKLELAKGQKNLKGLTMKTNRFKVEGDFSGTIYVPGDKVPEQFEIVGK